MPEITLPHQYMPRGYQLGMWQAFDAGIRRLVTIWHRRAGKDKSWLNLIARESQRRVGTYWYFLPQLAQGRRIIWDGMDSNGYRFLHHFPQELWDEEPNATLMRLRLKNGSVFQVVGSDNIDSLVGANPIGCVFSEYALQDPRGWDLVRPILRENKGWAGFNSTPRGKNHCWRLYNTALGNDDWFAERLTIDDTGVLDEGDIQAERDAGMPEELVQQEFYCSFEGGMAGAYYSTLIEKAYQDGRICDVRYDPALPVHTAWDLGMHDMTAIVFYQQPRHLNEIRVIDYMENSGEGLAFYKRQLQSLPYIYGDHFAPHDIGVREMGTGRSRLEAAREIGLKFTVTRKLPIEDGVDAVRMMLPLCWFDQKRAARLIESLASWRRDWDDKKQTWTRPIHDWASHGADAFRVLAVGRKRAYIPKQRDRYARHDFEGRSGTWMSG